MNGTESSLMVIIGIIVSCISFYISQIEIPHTTSERKGFLIFGAFILTAIYGGAAFIAGNIMFFKWLLNQ